MKFEEFEERASVKGEKKRAKTRPLGYTIFHLLVRRRNSINRDVLLSIRQIGCEPGKCCSRDAEKCFKAIEKCCMVNSVKRRTEIKKDQ